MKEMNESEKPLEYISINLADLDNTIDFLDQVKAGLVQYKNVLLTLSRYGKCGEVKRLGEDGEELDPIVKIAVNILKNRTDKGIIIRDTKRETYTKNGELNGGRNKDTSLDTIINYIKGKADASTIEKNGGLQAIAESIFNKFKDGTLKNWKKGVQELIERDNFTNLYDNYKRISDNLNKDNNGKQTDK